MIASPYSVDISANVSRVEERIAYALQRSGRTRASVTLVAVSKTQPAHVVDAGVQAGLRDFGENRVQEAEEKIALVHLATDVRWHLIGSLQKNKAGKAALLFDVIHSVDSYDLAHSLAQRVGSNQRLPILLQVNIAGETSKHGLLPADVTDVAYRVAELPRLELQGLMAIPPIATNAEQSRPWFRQVWQLFDQLSQRMPGTQWTQLSMGMSQDYDVAIEEGATIVRVGTALFGPRDPQA
jgi:pyridoxal phosphate enzyme (YggS family)